MKRLGGNKKSRKNNELKRKLQKLRLIHNQKGITYLICVIRLRVLKKTC